MAKIFHVCIIVQIAWKVWLVSMHRVQHILPTSVTQGKCFCNRWRFHSHSLKFKMGISLNNVCRLCNENEETLVHLFTLCNPVKKFWEDLTRRIKADINRDLIFSSKDIILGYQEKQMWPANILLVTMKKYIFVAAGKKKTPQVVEALEMLKNIFFEQEYVSRIQNHESEFKKKWDFIPRLLQ